MKKGIFVKLSGYEKSYWASEFEFAKKLGCGCVEFVLDYPLLGPLTYKKETLEKIKNMAGKLKLMLHLMPHRYNQVPELQDKIFDLASLDSKIRKFSIEEVKKSFEMAEQLGAGIVTVHGGLCENKKNYKKNINVLRDSLEELNSYCGAVKLCLENLPTIDHFGKPLIEIPSDPDDINYLVKDLDNVGVTLDIGHANTIMPPKEFFNKLDKVWNMHVHDNNGKDDHLPLGEGNINFLDFLEEIKHKDYKGYFSLELDINWEEGKLKKTPSKQQRRESWGFLKTLNSQI